MKRSQYILKDLAIPALKALLILILVAEVFIGFVLLLGKAAAQEPQVVSAMPSRDGGLVKLYSDAGPCVGDAHRAERILDGAATITGCWLIKQAKGLIIIAWMDGGVDWRRLSEVQGVAL